MIHLKNYNKTVRKAKTPSPFLNPKTGRISITDAFGLPLAELLAGKISQTYKEFPQYAAFPKKEFCKSIAKEVVGKSYTERVGIIANNLKKYLPEKYGDALDILMRILGPENPEETGMFTNFYWLMPVGKFVELYGVQDSKDFTRSIKAIEELTKRNTGEYAIRPYARAYPEKTLAVCTKWTQSKNFHLRRLASEGLRPKLPWATKLDVWNTNPKPVFEILEMLKEDEIKFVKKSVANHLRDWVKVNPKEAQKVIARWQKTKNEHTRWILKHAQR
jgi:3-methyladenine DNA glycosylase AlkC